MLRAIVWNDDWVGCGLGLAQQAVAHTGLALGRMVLAEFPFAAPAQHFHLDADNAAPHRVEVIGRSVVDRPGPFARALVLRGEGGLFSAGADIAEFGKDVAKDGRRRLSSLLFA